MGTVPKHIAIIIDGNRRFAKRLMMQPWKGHTWGAKKVTLLFDWCRELGIRELTLYAFSMQNFDRPKDEFTFLMRLFEQELEKMNQQESAIHTNNIRVVFIGRIHLFPTSLYQKMLTLMEATRQYQDYQVNFAMAYGGQEEIVDAVKLIATQVKTGNIAINEITEASFAKYLYLDHEPDFIIRTGGDHRTSNFLIWQSHYSEWFFLEKSWPDFEKEDLISCVEEFKTRDRRFGK